MRGFEAMEALKKGKKVKMKSWREGCYWYFDETEKCIFYVNPEGTGTPKFDINFIFNESWEIYKEYVSFTEAMKALEEGFDVTAWESEAINYPIDAHDDLQKLGDMYPRVSLYELPKMKWTIES